MKNIPLQKLGKQIFLWFLAASTLCMGTAKAQKMVPLKGFSSEKSKAEQQEEARRQAARLGNGFASIEVVASNSDYGNLPIFTLNGSDYISVSFDDLFDRDMSLRYRVVHLGTDGSPTQLQEIEYFNGINKTDIPVGELSFNTRSNYVHYQFSFPQGQRNVKVSGAYAFEIFASDKPDQVLLRIPFMVCENSVKIEAEVKVPRRVEWRMNRQELAVKVNTSECPIRIIQADQCLHVYAQQNMNTTTIRPLPMLYQLNNEYFYQDKDELVFDGLNEFRNFDIRPVNYAGRGVETNYLQNDRWNSFLQVQKSREYEVYTKDDDINGHFAVKAENMDNSALEAEYVNVHFFLQSEYLPGQEVYVVGGFNQWRCDATSQMEYNEGQRMYTLSLPIKQGFYDYMFALKTAQGEIKLPYLEGSFQETENDYYIYVFYREPGGRYDRFLGVKKVNSRDL